MRKGHGIIEFIFMMLLLLLFVVLIFYLVAGGSHAYEKSEHMGDVISNLRIGTSYIDNKIKQAQNGSISIETFEEIGTEAIVIEESVEGVAAQTVIYCKDGELLEAYYEKSDIKDPDLGTPIAVISSMKLEFVGEKVISILLNGDNGKQSKLLIDLDVRRRSNE